MTRPVPPDRDWTRGAIVFGALMKDALFVAVAVGILYVITHNGGSMR